MKAAQINKYGGNEVVVINEDAPEPTVSEGHLLVEVHAAGVNPVDWKIREGYMRQMVQLNFPATLGGDFSGKPENMSHVEAAALPLTGASAWQALVDHIGLSRDKKILIHGGAGGIGSIAIQLARHLGAYVAATVGAKDMPYIKELGADKAIDYKNQSFEDMLHDYDAVFDTVGGETYTRSYRVLKRGGMIVSMLEQPDSALMEQLGVNAIGQSTQVNSERLSRLAELSEKGVIKVHVERTYPLEQAGEALEYQKEGHPRGKVVLKIRED